MAVAAPSPEIVNHGGVMVAREDLVPGGTKARFFLPMFAQHAEAVYASPAEGGAQTALAWAARETGKRATIFVAKRKAPHPRTALARQWGANVVEIEPGHLSVVKARARSYAATVGAYLIPFGADVPGAVAAIAEAADAIAETPDEVWCAAGSGGHSRA
jgi:threonine dehydratase